MKVRHIVDLISDNGEILKTCIYTEEFKNKKEFDKEMVKQFSKSKRTMSIKEVIYSASSDTDYKTYKSLKHMKYFKEFKTKYGYSKMYKTSYMRVLDGKSTYLGKGKSPYIADLFRFFADKLNKSFLEVALDLLDSEYFGRKNTLLDVLLAEKNLDREEALFILGDRFNLLDSTRLCDLNLESKKIYDEAISIIE